MPAHPTLAKDTNPSVGTGTIAATRPANVNASATDSLLSDLTGVIDPAGAGARIGSNLTGAATGLSDTTRVLSNPNTWLRVAFIVIGLSLVLIGVSALIKVVPVPV